jgi:hypothetical protein
MRKKVKKRVFQVFLMHLLVQNRFHVLTRYSSVGRMRTVTSAGSW